MKQREADLSHAIYWEDTCAIATKRRVLRYKESLVQLAPIPWAKRVWALPFLSLLAPSERYYEQRGWQHKKITDWGRQMIRQLRRWLSDRYLVVVADSRYAVLELLACAAGLLVPVTVITRLRLDAAFYDPAPIRKAGTSGRPREVWGPPTDTGSPAG